MWIRNTSVYPDDEVKRLVKQATKNYDMRHVCVNVKGAKHGCRGMAYPQVPTISNAPPTADYLITIGIAPKIEEMVHNNHTVNRRPVYKTKDWRELLVVIAAHEACHIVQFRENLRRSEVRCEYAARYALSHYRTH